MYKNLIQEEKEKKIKRERDDENKCDVECVGIILLNIQIENWKYNARWSNCSF